VLGLWHDKRCLYRDTRLIFPRLCVCSLSKISGTRDAGERVYYCACACLVLKVRSFSGRRWYEPSGGSSLGLSEATRDDGMGGEAVTGLEISNVRGIETMVGLMGSDV